MSSMLPQSKIHRKSRRRKRYGGKSELEAPQANVQALIQRARKDPHGLNPEQAMQLQHMVGNQKAQELLAGGAVQREISEESFIEATTSSFLGLIKWRTGETTALEEIQKLLRAYQDASKQGVMAQYQALITLQNQLFKTRAKRGSKLAGALMTLKTEVQEELSKLMNTPEYREYREELESKEKSARLLKESELLGKTYEQATEEERNTRLMMYLQNHKEQASWLEGIEGKMTEEQALNRLTKNFLNRQDFQYTFQNSNPFQGKGDCETLRNEFIIVARDALGIKLDKGDLEKYTFLYGGGKIIDKSGLKGNVDNGAHWVFENHHWAVWKGRPIDVLYGLFGKLANSVEGSEVKDQPLYTFRFGDTLVYIASSRGPGNSYTLDPVKAEKNARFKG